MNLNGIIFVANSMKNNSCCDFMILTASDTHLSKVFIEVLHLNFMPFKLYQNDKAAFHKQDFLKNIFLNEQSIVLYQTKFLTI